MPEIKYGDHLMHEVENVAWDCTMTGTRRGFFLGFLVAVVVSGIAIGAIVMTGLHIPRLPAGPPPQRPDGTQELQAMREELNTLWQENQALKKQTANAAAVNCPPCRPQEAEKSPSDSRATTSVSEPTKQGTPKASVTPKASIPSHGKATQPASQPRVATAPREVPPAPPAPPAPPRVETPLQPAAMGLAIVEVRTSQGRLVPGVPISFRFLDKGNKQIGGVTVATNAGGRSSTAIPLGTACAEYHMPAEYIKAGRIKPEVSTATGLPLSPGLFRTCGEILAHPNGIIGVFTID